jgi:hypothetical protein
VVVALLTLLCFDDIRPCGVTYFKVRKTPVRVTSRTRSNDVSSICRTVP